MSVAIYPGSFDPITKGHQSIALRAAGMFECLFIAIGENTDKRCMFSLEQRILFIEKTFAEVKNIQVVSYKGLTIDFCMEHHINYIVRGLRSGIDWHTESSMANANKLLAPSIETIFLLTDSQCVGVSSSVVRDILKNGGDVSAFVPATLLPILKQEQYEL
ncbi:MAG: pantetheine-phosphate adenylyltransferase [Bacteroidales bacterium]|jgi:pantetheine-phosphate adenylyltransferase|nr:pantetheine-phosphate adenylyltransferase [Bacteroidales bacterium]